MNEELQSRIESLRDDFDDLLDDLSMTEVTEELGETATTISGIPGKIQAIRDRGYAYANFLEPKAETLGTQWEAVHVSVREGIRRELINARNEMADLDQLWDELDDMIAEDGQSFSPARSGKSLADMLQEAADSSDEAVGGSLAAMKKAAKAQASTTRGSLGSALRSSKAQGVSDAEIEAFLGRLESAMKRAESFVENAKNRIQGLYGTVPENVDQTLSQIKEIEGYLDIADNATFDFLADEDLYMAVKAEWQKTGNKKEDPDGFFYVTSSRLLMEQSEKKGGFLGFGGKKESGFLWEAPIGTLENATAEKKGMLGGIDLIHMSFGSGGPFTETTIEVKGGVQAQWFASRLEQAASGEIEKQRGLERDQAVVEAIAEAPTMCPVCGATFTQQITRGMQQLECEYCGAAVRLAV